MTVTESAVQKVTEKLLQKPGAKDSFMQDPVKRRAYMEMLLDTECGAEVCGELIRFDLGCAQAVIPYAALEQNVLEALKNKI